VYILIYKYKIPIQKNGIEEKISNSQDMQLSRAKSMSVEIKKIRENKNNNMMSLSGVFDEVEEVNSEEEEEKLVQKEAYTEKDIKNITELEYILHNFEDFNMDDVKNLDCLKNLSVVSLRDDIRTPELKNYLSNTLEMQK
jgi:hypothetical protein